MSEIVSAPIATILWDVKKKLNNWFVELSEGKFPWLISYCSDVQLFQLMG